LTSWSEQPDGWLAAPAGQVEHPTGRTTWTAGVQCQALTRLPLLSADPNSLHIPPSAFFILIASAEDQATPVRQGPAWLNAARGARVIAITP